MSKGDDVKLSKNAVTVLERRYLRKDKEGKPVETPLDMFKRVAKHIAYADKLYHIGENEIANTEKAFYNMIKKLEFLPNSPTLMNAGREMGQLSACFVLPIEDSMNSIFETIKNTAIIHKSGGGTGFSFSRLRPKNSRVQVTGGVASGPVSFMKVFDAATQAVKQGGMRRGANMGILRIDHPDILEFIKCKQDNSEITNFNISVALTKEFMKKVEKGVDYNLINPHNGEIAGKLNAKEVFNLIVESAWKNGEPGIIFLDKINEKNPTPDLGEIESTNPCGEQPLLPYESCNLGSINLARFIKTDKQANREVDWKKLRKIIRNAVHFLDNVIDINKFPLKLIEQQTKSTRKIGLGVMGWADMLVQLGIPYNSEEAIMLAEKLMYFIRQEARKKSVELAKRKSTFPAFKGSVYDGKKGLKLRNATLTTIAPAGTISIIANSSSGIEPIFALSYFRNVMDNDKLIEVHPIFEKVAKKRGFYSRELMEKIADKGTIHDIDEIPQDVKEVFVTSHDISYQWHIRMQSTFQKYTDNAVSKTINFPQQTTKDEIREAYKLAFNSTCKGITIYRDKSRDEQVLNVGLNKTDKEAEKAVSVKTQRVFAKPRPRPKVIKGTTTKMSTGCGNLYVTINEDENGQPFEAFVQMGKTGGCAASQLEAVARLVSLAFRSGIDTKIVLEQLRGIRCPSPSWEKGGRIFSCADAIARVLEKRLERIKLNKKLINEEKTYDKLDVHIQTEETVEAITNVVGVCPDCGDALRHESGCVVCNACGYSKC